MVFGDNKYLIPSSANDEMEKRMGAPMKKDSPEKREGYQGESFEGKEESGMMPAIDPNNIDHDILESKED
jgi:hypothetical protein